MQKNLSLAILGPSGSGKTTYLTALMFYFYNSTEWILHPDLGASKFYQQNIVKLQEGEFPPATLEEKVLSFELIHKDTQRRYRVQTRDFRGSDLRQWLDGEGMRERTKAVEDYFEKSQAFLFLVSPDHLNSVDRARYEEDLSLYERALEKVYDLSLKSGLPKSIAIGITKIDRHPQIQEDLQGFIHQYLKRLDKNLQFYTNSSSALIPLSSVGKDRVVFKDENPPRYAIEGDLEPFQVEKPLFFLFEKMAERTKALKKRRFKILAFGFLIFLTLYSIFGLYWGFNLRHKISSSSSSALVELEDFSRFYPWQVPLLHLDSLAQERRHQQVAQWMDWANQRMKEIPYEVHQKLEEWQRVNFLSPLDRKKIGELKKKCVQAAFQKALDLEESLSSHPESYGEIHRAFAKIRQVFPHFSSARVQDKLIQWKKRREDLEYWKLKIVEKALPRPEEALEIWKGHLRNHEGCPYAEDVRNRIVELDEKICQRDLAELKFFSSNREEDSFNLFNRYLAFLKSHSSWANHAEGIRKKILSLADRNLKELQKELPAKKTLSSLGRLLKKGNLSYLYGSMEGRAQFQKALWKKIGKDGFEGDTEALLENFAGELKAYGLWDRLSREQGKILLLRKGLQFQELSRKFSRGKIPLKDLRTLWKEVFSLCQETSEKKGLELLKEITLRMVETSMEEARGSLEKIEGGILAIEELKRKVRRLPRGIFESYQREVLPGLDQNLMGLHQRMYKSLPLYWGRDLAKLKKYHQDILLFLHTCPDFKERDNLVKVRESLEALIGLEELLQNPKLSAADKQKALGKKFSFADSSKHPRLFKRIQQFYRDREKEGFGKIQKNYQAFRKEILSLQKNPSVKKLRQAIQDSRSLEGEILNFLKFQKEVPSLKRALHFILEKREILYYFLFRHYWQKNQSEEALSTLEESLKNFPQGIYQKELRAHQKRFKRILKRATYKITIYEGDLPNDQQEAPDGYVIVKSGGREWSRTKIIYDNWYPQWKEILSFQWKQGDLLELWVYDSDPWARGGDDLMGRYQTRSSEFIEWWNDKKKEWVPRKKVKLIITRPDGFQTILVISFSY